MAKMTSSTSSSAHTTKWAEDYNDDSRKLSKYLISIDKERRTMYKGECLF